VSERAPLWMGIAAGLWWVHYAYTEELWSLLVASLFSALTLLLVAVGMWQHRRGG
jgi:hypothetical protein